MRLTVLQLLPELEVGGVEQGTIEIAEALVAAGHRALVVSAGGRLVPHLEAVGAQHVALSIGRKRLATLGHILRLRDLYVRERVDIVHARSRLPAWIGYWARRALAPNLRPRWVTTVHGPYTVNAYSRIMASGEQVIAISEFIRDYVLRAYPHTDPRRLTVIPRGVDRTRYAYHYEPSSSWRAAWATAQPQLRGRRILCLPARLTRWKGQEDFIALVGQLIAQDLPVHGLIVGGPHPRKRAYAMELERLIAARGLGAHVSLLGSRDDLRDILAVSDLVFSLTLEPEAFGRTTIEALSLGRPVIGYDHGGTGEILREVYPAGLVPAGDVAAAVARAAALLDDAPIVPAHHPYTLEQMQQATLQIYATLARERPVA